MIRKTTVLKKKNNTSYEQYNNIKYRYFYIFHDMRCILYYSKFTTAKYNITADTKKQTDI